MFNAATDTIHSTVAPEIVQMVDARAIIAATILGDDPHQHRIGDVTLHPHQRSAVARTHRTITAHRGALLCDDVGLGKTYVALAVAMRYEPVAIVAPAALADMWHHALKVTHTTAEFVSIESLGRTGAPNRRRGLIIVDEAHNFRNTSTRRYSALARMCMITPILLLTATPLHNSRDDVTAIAALFLGSRAYSMDVSELAPLIVRRNLRLEAGHHDIPVVEHVQTDVVTESSELLDAIISLPPPVPPRDGKAAARLVAHGLVRQLASSNAALVAAVKRRIAVAHGLLASLDAGRYPSAAELSAWEYNDDAVQLAFAELLVPVTVPVAALNSALRQHVAALGDLLTLARQYHDDGIARTMRDIISAHPGELIVAFSCYAETADAVYRMIRQDGHAALVSGRGAMIVSGPVPRVDVLRQFTPHESARRVDEHEAIRFLVATDLLSEGVNLQLASVVIHLDLPWTAARVEQRIGRIARLGSPHRRVVSYTVAHSPRVEAFLRQIEIIARKSDLAARIFGTSSAVGYPTQSSQRSLTERGEHVCDTMEKWRRAASDPLPDFSGVRIAFAHGPRAAALGAWMVDGAATLLAWDETHGIRADPSAIEAAIDLAGCSYSAACTSDCSAPKSNVTAILRSAESWYQQLCAWHALGASDGLSTIPGVHDARRTLARVADAAAANSSFARRPKSAAATARLRSAAAGPFPIAVEWSLEALADSSDGAAVDTILELVDTARPPTDQVQERGLRCVALILVDPAPNP